MSLKTFKKTNNTFNQVDYTPKHIIAGDTDSAIISLSSIFPNKDHLLDDVVNYSDKIAIYLNSQFPDFMMSIFNVPVNRSNIISTKRETVTDKSLFIAKKNYILHIVDKEGIRKESTKYVGVEIKKSNTPKIIQNFLISLVNLLMDRVDYNTINTYVSDFKQKYHTLSALEIGNPTTIKNISKFEDKLELQGDFKGFSQHAKGSIIYNSLCSKSDKQIYSGMKIKILYVKHKDYTCIAVPSDLTSLPEFLTEIPIDNEAMWETVQKKIDRYLIPCKLDRNSRQKEKSKSFVSF